MGNIQTSNLPIQQQEEIVELGFQNPNSSDPISPPSITEDDDHDDVVVLNQGLNNLALNEVAKGEALPVESSISQAPIDDDRDDDDDTSAIETSRQDADTGANEQHIIPREEEGEPEQLQEKMPERGDRIGTENKWPQSEHQQENNDNTSADDEAERGQDACGDHLSGPENGDDSGGTRESNEEDQGIVTEYEYQGKIENEWDDNVGGDDDSVELKDEKHRRYHYPLRPDAEDCSYYIRMGTCKFGSNCKFNHPLRRRKRATKEMMKQKVENSERVARTECKYYSVSGGCKYGNACRYNHSREKIVVAPVVEFNFLGLPIRQGKKECPYYMRNGSCKFGSNCRFNHPDPTEVVGGDPLSKFGSSSIQGGMQDTISGWSPPRSSNETTPVMSYIYPPTTEAHPKLEWDRYQAPVYPTSERSLPTPPAFSMNFAASDAKFYSQNQQKMQVEEYPERPGQPECSYYMRTGDCKYRSGCKFHHPKHQTTKISSCAVSDQGLPLRPDQNMCTSYVRYGICKFGPTCKYDHPATYGNSASSDGSAPGQHQYGNTTTADPEWERESMRQQSL